MSAYATLDIFIRSLLMDLVSHAITIELHVQVICRLIV